MSMHLLESSKKCGILRCLEIMIALDWSKSNGQILEGTYYEEPKLWTRYHTFVDQELTFKNHLRVLWYFYL